MNISKYIYTFIEVGGILILGGWMLVDILSPNRLNIGFAIVGLLSIVWGSLELNHIQLMEKLNESKST